MGQKLRLLIKDDLSTWFSHKINNNCDNLIQHGKVRNGLGHYSNSYKLWFLAVAAIELFLKYLTNSFAQV